MTPNASELLHETRDACLKITELTEGFTREDNLGQELYRFGVDWNVVIVGEAMDIALGEAGGLEERLPSARRAIAT